METLSFKTLFSQSWYFFRSNLGLIIMVTLPWVFLSEIASLLLLSKMGEEINRDLLILAHSVIAPFYLVPLLLILFSRNNKVPLKQEQITRLALKKWFPVAICTMLISLATGYLLILFVLPAAWLAARLSYSYFYIVFAHQPALTAIVNSFKATKKLQWPLFAIFSIALVFKIIVLVSLKLSEVQFLIFGINSIELVINTCMHVLVFFVYVASFRAWSVMQVVTNTTKVNADDDEKGNEND